jgi:GTP cyclohydrolase FolE2
MAYRTGLVPGHAGGGDHLNTFFSQDEHRRVLDTSIDVPKEKPSFPLPLDQVGISGKTVWVCFNNEQWSRLPFTAEILINLPGDVRGIHMSRIEQAISDLHNDKFDDLRDYVLQLGNKVMKGQSATTGSIALQGQMPLLQRTPVSEKLSIDTVEISVQAEFHDNNNPASPMVMMGAALCHLTACPCTLAYNESLFNHHDATCPLATHSQRTKTALTIESNSTTVPTLTFDELIDCLSGALHVSRDLLKRPDEAELILKAHRQPQFVEDVVRETAREVGRRFGDRLPPSTRVCIKSLSLESIHIHDVTCRLNTSLEEILNLLQQ